MIGFMVTELIGVDPPLFIMEHKPTTRISRVCDNYPLLTPMNDRVTRLRFIIIGSVAPQVVAFLIGEW